MHRYKSPKMHEWRPQKLLAVDAMYATVHQEEGNNMRAATLQLWGRKSSSSLFARGYDAFVAKKKTHEAMSVVPISLYVLSYASLLISCMTG